MKVKKIAWNSTIILLFVLSIIATYLIIENKYGENSEFRSTLDLVLVGESIIAAAISGIGMAIGERKFSIREKQEQVVEKNVLAD